MRVHLACRRMSLREADILEYYLKNVPGVTAVKVFDRTQDAIITYQADRTALHPGAGRLLLRFGAGRRARAGAYLPAARTASMRTSSSSRSAAARSPGCSCPTPSRRPSRCSARSSTSRRGSRPCWHGKLSVAVLDATAVTVSMLRGDFDTAGSVMFMLRLGEILEEWTHKKSVADLAGAMALNVDKVWLQVWRDRGARPHRRRTGRATG